jgi:acyl-CoA reductase-like NAD-dependent aldehyde dehydrogenase
VKKTYKLYIGGKFPRSESGRSYVVADSRGRFLANAARASRKDARDAVAAARPQRACRLNVLAASCWAALFWTWTK